MFDTYRPKQIHNFLAMPFLLAGLYVGHNFTPPTYDVVIFCLTCYAIAFYIGVQVNVSLILYTYYTNKTEERVVPVKQNGETIYEFTD